MQLGNREITRRSAGRLVFLRRDEQGNLTETNTPVVLALDIGTSSLRGTLHDSQLRTIRNRIGQRVEHRSAYELQTTADGGAFLNPDELCGKTIDCIDRLLDLAGDLSANILGVGSSTLVANVLGVDKAGRAVTPLYTWADTRGREAVSWLRDQFDEQEVHQRTGCLFHTSYLTARLRWLQKAQPKLYKSVDRWLSLDDYLRWQLFDQTVPRPDSSTSQASWTGLLNRHILSWDHPLVSALGLSPDQLPILVNRNRSNSGLSEKYARRWPVLKDIPWFPAIGDGVASNLGSGGTKADHLVINIGTSAAIRAVVPGAPAVPPGLWSYRVDDQYSLLGGALSNAGNVYDWMSRTLRLGSTEEIEKELTSRAPDAHSLTVLPFLAGERAPGWAADARGAIVGLSLNTDPLDILQASLEAVAFRLASIYDALRDAVPAGANVIVSGGGAVQSATWMQMLADLLNQPVQTTAERDATSRGVAASVFETLGYFDDLEAIPPPDIENQYLPDAKRHHKYREAMVRQLALYERLIAGH